MREMKDSGLPWIGTVPVHWEIKPNKYLMKKLKQIQPIYDGEDIISLTVNGVIKRDLDNPSGKMPTSFDGYQFVYPGNLLMCLFDIDVTPRCIGLIKDFGLTSPAYSQFVINQDIEAAYYYYYYLNLDFNKDLLHLAKNQRHSLNEEQFGAIKTVVPPLKEQIAIAKHLDEKCAEIDALIADIQAQIETLEQYKRSTIAEAVTKGLDNKVELKDSTLEWIGKIPAHWEIKPNKYLMKKIKQIQPIYDGEDIISLTVNGVIKRDLDNPSGKMPTSFDGYQFVYPGNLLMCLFDIDVTPRCIGLIKDFGLTSPAYSQFVLNKGVDAAYYYYYYLNLDFNKELLHLAKNQRHSLNEEQFGAIKTVVPPLEEQIAIAKYLDERCDEINECISVKQEQINTLEAYKKSIIFEYVTGKKEVV